MAEADPRLGAVLQGRYKIQARLASGGMGVVYRGERLGLGRPVAIKFLHAWVATQEQVVQRFEIEARAMSRLSHPSCVSVIDFGVHEETPYLVMDFAAGRPLRELLAGGPLPARQALALCRQVLAGLSHAHAQGITHRDIKPENIVVDEIEGLGRQGRILDFGVAKLHDLSSGLTTGFAVGTPSYMAPEQTVGGAVDARTDVYAMGVLLFEMLAGRKPFIAENAIDVLRMQREEPPPRLADVGIRISPALEAVVAKALAKAPEARFQSARELADALEATPEAGSAAKAPTGRPLPRKPMIIAGAAAAGGSLLALLIWLLARGSGTPRAAASADAGLPDPIVEIEPPSTAPTDAELPGIGDVHAAIKAGRWNAAVDGLRKLRKKYPDNAYVPYLLGTLYLDRLWGEDGFEAYRAAVRLDPAYRSNPVVIRSAIRTFISDNNAPRGTAFLRDEVGAAAIPFLEETRDGAKNPNVRRRAEAALAQIHSARAPD